MPKLPEPTITLAFQGLIVFCFDRGSRRFHAGFLGHDPRHCLAIDIEERGAPSAEFKTILSLTDDDKRKGAGSLKITGDLSFSVSGRANDADIHPSGAVGDFDRKNPNNDPEDFRWVVDLESKEFFGCKLKIRPGNVFARKMTINHGLFYTATKWFVIMDPPIAGHDKEFEVARVIGCNVTLGKEETAFLSFGPEENNRIELPVAPGAQYRVSIKNRCEPDTGPGPGDFHRYFNEVLEDVRPDKPFEFLTSDIQEGDGKLNVLLRLRPLMQDWRPCDFVHLSRHDSLNAG